MTKKYISTKTYGHDIGLSCAFRQWRATHSHCSLIHGYAISVHIEFEAEVLDDKNWVVDFGSLGLLKDRLKNTFDHKLCVAKDDPKLNTLKNLQNEGLANIVILDAVGCEAFAEHVYGIANLWLEVCDYKPRVKVSKIEIREHGANSAQFIPE